jgi:tetratricopeptide (TPR) repeat protein
MELGRVREGVALVETAVDRASAMQMVASFALWLSYLGHVYLSAGRLDEARDRAREALELARQQGERGHEAWALKLLGDVEAHTSAEDAAMHAYGASLAIAVELGMRPLIARCHHALGRLAGTRGDLAAARAETAEAAALACTLGLHLS